MQEKPLSVISVSTRIAKKSLKNVIQYRLRSCRNTHSQDSSHPKLSQNIIVKALLKETEMTK